VDKHYYPLLFRENRLLPGDGSDTLSQGELGSHIPTLTSHPSPFFTDFIPCCVSLRAPRPRNHLPPGPTRCIALAGSSTVPTPTFLLHVEIPLHRVRADVFVLVRILLHLLHQRFNLWPRSFKTISCLQIKTGMPSPAPGPNAASPAARGTGQGRDPRAGSPQPAWETGQGSPRPGTGQAFFLGLDLS